MALLKGCSRILLALLFVFSGTFAGEYCVTSFGRSTYCDNGCCRTSRGQTCCPAQKSDAGELCVTSPGRSEYCDNGCCGTAPEQTCCTAAITVTVIAAGGTVGGCGCLGCMVLIWCYATKNNRIGTSSS